MYTGSQYVSFPGWRFIRMSGTKHHWRWLVFHAVITEK